ncbi:MAG: Flp pilus assembly protein CpaB, partial [Cyanobacteria bacterium]|nr:Flp pilus assembly protein CpaB [Cyanobacteriota bacterium]
MAVKIAIKKGYVFIGIALFMAVMSAILLSKIASKEPEVKAPPKVETKMIAVASKLVPMGDTISGEDIKMVPWPEKYLTSPTSIFTDRSSLVGRTARADLFPGEPIFKEKLSGEKSGGGLPVLIPAGYRAVTVGVTEIKGVAGFVKPGDRVDVVATFEDKSDTQLKITKTVLQNVLVMASAQQMVKETETAGTATFQEKPDTPVTATKDGAPVVEPPKKSEQDIEKEKKELEKERKERAQEAKTVTSVTLALKPEDAQKLTLAEDTGTLRLVLRPEGEGQIDELAGVTTSELFQGDIAPTAAPVFRALVWRDG